MSSRAGRGDRRSENRSSAAGGSYPGSGYYRRKRRKERERRKRMFVGVAVAVLVLALAVIGAKKLIRLGQSAAAQSAAAESTVEETALKTAVTINDVDITGMSRMEARKAVLQKYQWGMKAVLEQAGEGDEPYPISDLLSVKLDKILDEIYSSKAPTDSYALDAEGLDAEIAAEAAAMAERWNVQAKNGAVSGYNKETNSFSYSDSVDGRSVNQEAAAAAIRTAMQEKNYGEELRIPAEIQKAELSAAQAKEQYRVIGTFTTEATANADRNNNLKLACEAIDGTILQVGEEFSFNHTTGNRTLEKGYKPAGAYLNGKVVLEPGGGVCQISSTLYNAVIKAGLTPTERHAHTFEPSYVTPGEDAAVSYDGYSGPDMRFVNTTNSAVALRANFHDRTVTMSVIGLPVLEEGVTISLHSVKTEEYDNGGVEYVEDTTLQPGIEKQITGGSMGSRWVTNIVTKKNGEVQSDVFFHNSGYKGHSKKIARNTSGVVTEPSDAEAMTIVENTETVPEQASNSATVAPGASGDGSSVRSSAAAVNASTKSSNAGPGVEGTRPQSQTIPAPAETSAALSPQGPAGPGENSAGPGGGSSETVAPFPGN